jgi:hypothetical protein
MPVKFNRVKQAIAVSVLSTFQDPSGGIILFERRVFGKPKGASGLLSKELAPSDSMPYAIVAITKRGEINESACKKRIETGFVANGCS